MTGVDQPQNALSPVRAGLFPGMAVCQKLVWDPPLPRTSATYWTMMQLAMSLGFFTAWPELRPGSWPLVALWWSVTGR